MDSYLTNTRFTDVRARMFSIGETVSLLRGVMKASDLLKFYCIVLTSISEDWSSDCEVDTLTLCGFPSAKSKAFYSKKINNEQEIKVVSHMWLVKRGLFCFYILMEDIMDQNNDDIEPVFFETLKTIQVKK